MIAASESVDTPQYGIWRLVNARPLFVNSAYLARPW